MTQEHPITPSPELILEWCRGWNCTSELTPLEQVATQAARWGADQELKGCCEHVSQWFATPKYRVAELRAARRPKPPSLKERGREALQSIHAAVVMGTGGHELDVLKEIVESLPD